MLKTWLPHRSRSRPRLRPSLQMDVVGRLAEGRIGPASPREGQGEAKLLADRGVDRDEHQQVHRMADPGSAHKRRPQGGPGPVAAALAIDQEILLVVVEVRGHVPRVALLGGRLVGAEVAAVGLAALHQVDVTQAGRRRLDGRDEVAEHRPVGEGKLGLGPPGQEGRVEDVRDVLQAAQDRSARRGVEQVHTEPTDGAGVIRRASGQGDDVPVGPAPEVVDDPQADDPAGAGDEGNILRHRFALRVVGAWLGLVQSVTSRRSRGRS